METIHGKEFNYGDILLYNIRNNEIIAIVNDQEQLKKFNFTGKHTDAPIAILPYSKETELEIISSMKQIKEYSISSSADKNIKVKYVDGTSILFDSTNLEVVAKNLSAQRDLTKEKAIGNWYDVPEPEKVEKKKDVKRKLTKGLATILAASMIVGGAYHGGKFIKNKLNDNKNDDYDPRMTEENVTATTSFKDEGKALCNEIKEKSTFILQSNEIAEIEFNENMSLQIVEYINGLYPTNMHYMNEQNASAELSDTEQAINLIIASNLYPDTKAENMIDLSSYIVNEKEKVYVHNAMTIARFMINESIGESMNGEILDESEWSEVNKFSRQYTDAVDQLLNYELDTINDPSFMTMSSGCRFLITSIFQNANNVIPQHSFVTRISENDERVHDVYYRYFQNDVTKDLYLPRADVNGNTIYIRTYYDEKGNCHEEVITENVMFAMAGMSTLEEQRNLGIEANPEIYQLGIQIEIDTRVEKAKAEMQELTKKDTVVIK